MIKTKLSANGVRTISQQVAPRAIPVYAPGRIEARAKSSARAVNNQNNRFTRLMIFSALSLVSFAFCLTLNFKSFSEMQLQQQRQGVLNVEIKQLQEVNTALIEEINNSQSDPATIERAARQRLNMVRANERILVPAN